MTQQNEKLKIEDGGSRPVDAVVIPLTGEKELTFDERARWGECPICKAQPGEYCFATVGLQLGTRADGNRMQDGDGVHMARLQKAPSKVKLVAV